MKFIHTYMRVKHTTLSFICIKYARGVLKNMPKVHFVQFLHPLRSFWLTSVNQHSLRAPYALHMRVFWSFHRLCIFVFYFHLLCWLIWTLRTNRVITVNINIISSFTLILLHLHSPPPTTTTTTIHHSLKQTN